MVSLIAALWQNYAVTSSSASTFGVDSLFYTNSLVHIMFTYVLKQANPSVPGNPAPGWCPIQFTSYEYPNNGVLGCRQTLSTPDGAQLPSCVSPPLKYSWLEEKSFVYRPSSEPARTVESVRMSAKHQPKGWHRKARKHINMCKGDEAFVFLSRESSNGNSRAQKMMTADDSHSSYVRLPSISPSAIDIRAMSLSVEQQIVVAVIFRFSHILGEFASRTLPSSLHALIV